MSEVEQPLARAVGALVEARVPFMVAGSLASSFHGLPRTTQDLDLVIDPADRDALDRVVDAFVRGGHYVDRDAARDAFVRRSMFNAVDPTNGWKVDLVVRKRRPFSVSEFERRFPTTLLGVPVSMATAEDTVVAKLEWSLACGGSERQRRDIEGILEMNDANFDFAYVERWVRDLRLESEWLAVQQAKASSENGSR
jgi:hypothetical protein